MIDASELSEISDQLTLLEFAVQDLIETEGLESAEDAWLQAQELCEILDRCVRKEKDDGYRLQQCDPGRQRG